MAQPYAAIEPFSHAMLAVGDGHEIYWETCGNPAGKPALVLHGGPGSGCSPWHRRLFDPARYRCAATSVCSAGWCSVVREIERLSHVPAVLINGRYDLQAPLATAWELNRRWPRSELVVIGDAGHSASNARLAEAIVNATDRFAGT